MRGINIIDYRVNNIVNTVYTHSNRIRKLKYYPKESIGSQNILFSASDDTTIVINNIDIIKENECNIIEKKRLADLRAAEEKKAAEEAAAKKGKKKGKDKKK
jgi:hypothetical protein